MGLNFHRLVQDDLEKVLDYYEREGGSKLADRFFAELEAVLGEIDRNPAGFHFAAPALRRANLPTFPYHLLFRQTPTTTRVLVLRHHRRNPNYGARRR